MRRSTIAPPCFAPPSHAAAVAAWRAARRCFRTDLPAAFGCALALLLAAATPAAAQLAGNLAVQSDYRVRGYSVSSERAVVALSGYYDHGSGFYLTGSAIAGPDAGDDLAMVGAIGSLGYARRLTPELSADVGVVRSDYFRPDNPRGDLSYTEGYVGLAGRGLSARLSYSPDYFRPDVQTLYAEANFSPSVLVALPAALRLEGHLGTLQCLDAPTGERCRSRYDWRIGLSRLVGPIDLHASVSGGDFIDDEGGVLQPSDATLVVGASWAF